MAGGLAFGQWVPVPPLPGADSIYRNAGGGGQGAYGEETSFDICTARRCATRHAHLGCLYEVGRRILCREGRQVSRGVPTPEPDSGAERWIPTQSAAAAAWPLISAPGEWRPDPR